MAEGAGRQDTPQKSPWKKWIKERKLGIPNIAWATITAIIGVLVAAAYTQITKKSEEEVALEAVAKLSAGQTVENFESMLGGPAQVNKKIGPLREAMWINEIYAVKAITEASGNGVVVGYTVTTRSTTFNPEIPYGDNIGRLGESRFSELPDVASASRVGRHLNGYWFYDEALRAGWATNYETWLLGSGSSGVGGESAGSREAVSTLVDAAIPSNFQSVENSRRVSNARSGLIITTYGSLSDGFDLGDLPQEFDLAPDRVESNKYPAKEQ
ncbi:hypothetical protein E1193_27000 [Micromonospora sp. KC606]|uniref:ETEC_3214 domain-containing protein n=1 Tax=Micromonospora sp. KC606 TaxID=2530379 RepID=UPI00104687C6|nr:ETEC_3214 domain-containing protein [Micromonospora sp. KC606]TDC72771.1 hypothetical protein E1193_27000 [Micromonospora sp. KC606]